MNIFFKNEKERVRVMRIDAYNQVNQIYKAAGSVKSDKLQKTSKRDKVEISSFGKAYQVAKQAVASAPDVRQDKIADIKERIQNGTYDVSPEAFADKLLSDYDVFI